MPGANALKLLVQIAIYLSDHEWCTAREIANALDIPARGEGSPNHVLYAYREFFVRREEYVPLWQIAPALRDKARKAKFRYERREGIGPAAEAACAHCLRNVSQSVIIWGDLCEDCFQLGRRAFEKFGPIVQVKLPTMKDFHLYDSD